MSLSVIVQTVKRHLEDLVGLTQAVPGSVVPLVHFNGVSERKHTEESTPLLLVQNPLLTNKVVLRPVGLDGSRGVFHFHVFVAHQSPGPQAPRVEFERPLEVQRGLLVLRA